MNSLDFWILATVFSVLGALCAIACVSIARQGREPFDRISRDAQEYELAAAQAAALNRGGGRR